MSVKIKKENKQNIPVLLDRLKGIQIQNDSIDIGSAFAFDDIEWLFLSIIDFGCLLSIESRKNILKNTIKQVAVDNKYEKDYFLKLLNNQIKQHHNKKERIYYLLTTISTKNLPFRKLKISDSVINLHGNQFPKKFRDSRNSFLQQYGKKKENEDYTKVSVVIKAKDFKDAYEQSYQYLEVFRSLLCLFLNSSKEIRFDDRLSKPINKIRHSEILTLHNEDGTSASPKYFWYVQDYKEANSLVLTNEKREKLKSFIVFLIRRLNKCKIKHHKTIVKALNMYSSAFDESNKYTCFLKSWSVLEILLDTDDNDTLIKRCLAIYDSKSIPYQKQILESLREYRNEYVHKGGDGLDPLVACFQIQKLIFNLIVKFNFMYSGFFNNIKEANLFLDNYSPDIKELKTRKKIIDRAIKLKEKITNN